METALGLVGILVFAAAVIALAAAITWVVVKVSPTEKEEPTQAAEDGAGKPA